MNVHDKTNGDVEDLVQLSFFIEMAKAISRAHTIEETLNQVMRRIGEIFSPLHWSLLLVNPETEDLIFTLVIGKNSEKLQGQVLPKGEGIAGWIATEAQSVIVEDVAEDTRFSKRVDSYTGFETQSIIGVPLVSGTKVFGVIELINKMNGKAFTPMELKILKTIADFAAIAIEKAYFNAALDKLASMDGLTGVYNRRAFEEILDREMRNRKRYECPLSLLMLDIDDFKQINDTYGHAVGDEVLKCLAKIMQETVRSVDSVCRFGGDEFIIVMPNTSNQQAETVKQRIQDRLEYENSLGKKVAFKVSIGSHTQSEGERSTFMDMLDSDLYRQKARKEPRNIHDVGRHVGDMLQEERTRSKSQQDPAQHSDR